MVTTQKQHSTYNHVNRQLSNTLYDKENYTCGKYFKKNIHPNVMEIYIYLYLYLSFV